LLFPAQAPLNNPSTAVTPRTSGYLFFRQPLRVHAYNMSPHAAFMPATAGALPLHGRSNSSHVCGGRAPRVWTPGRRSCGAASARASSRGADYYSEEGIGELESSLPDAVIYASLRRKAETMCVEAAIAVCKELAGAGPGLAGGGAAAQASSLSPRT
jgi:hypothetical protein